MPLVARHMMEPHVVTVAPHATLSSVERLFAEEEIHGAPVVEEDGRVVGVLSSLDLLRALSQVQGSGDLDPDLSGPLTGRVASDIMTQQLVTVDADASIPAVARAMRDNQVHRVLVVEDGRLQGIISSFDLVALLEKDDLA